VLEARLAVVKEIISKSFRSVPIDSLVRRFCLALFVFLVVYYMDLFPVFFPPMGNEERKLM